MADDDKTRGRDAEFILNHPVFKDAWMAAEMSLKAQRIRCAMKDAEMHTRLVMADQILESVKKYIENIVTTGKLAELQLERKRPLHKFF